MEELERRVRLQEQVSRLISDAESEKEARRRTNQDIAMNFKAVDERLKSIEQKLYWFAGSAAAFYAVFHFLFK